MWLAGLRSFLAGSRAQGQCWSGFLGESLSFFFPFFFFTCTPGRSQWASELMCIKHKLHDAHLTEEQTIQSVALIRILLLFLNKITWAGSAGGGRAFRVQQLLLLLLLSPESSGSNAGAG